MRRDSALAQLTEDQQADLYDWLSSDSYAVVLKRVAEPPPTGFGIKTHTTTLFRFYRDYTERLRAAEALEINSASDPAALLESSRTELAHATWILSRSPRIDAQYNMLSRALHRQEMAALRKNALDLQQQKLALERDRVEIERARLAELQRQFEFDAAREVMKRNLEYQKIHQIHDLDEHSKILLARDLCFGLSSASERTDSVSPHLNTPTDKVSPETDG